MKDVISILQSRIAKRKKEFFKLGRPVYIYEDSFEYSVYSKVRDGLKPNHPAVVALAKEQKQDKRILAEIVRLRRKTKRLSAEEQFDIVFDKRFEELVAGVIRSNFVEVTEDGEKPLDEEMVCALLKARWGE